MPTANFQGRSPPEHMNLLQDCGRQNLNNLLVVLSFAFRVEANGGVEDTGAAGAQEAATPHGGGSGK